jgi:hypothetical protein
MALFVRFTIHAKRTIRIQLQFLCYAGGSDFCASGDAALTQTACSDMTEVHQLGRAFNTRIVLIY